MSRIVLDAMGGDYAPRATVAGAVEAARDGITVVLVGIEEQVRAGACPRRGPDAQHRGGARARGRGNGRPRRPRDGATPRHIHRRRRRAGPGRIRRRVHLRGKHRRLPRRLAHAAGPPARHRATRHRHPAPHAPGCAAAPGRRRERGRTAGAPAAMGAPRLLVHARGTRAGRARGGAAQHRRGGHEGLAGHGGGLLPAGRLRPALHRQRGGPGPATTPGRCRGHGRVHRQHGAQARRGDELDVVPGAARRGLAVPARAHRRPADPACRTTDA